MLRKPYAKIVVAALLVLLAVQGVNASTGYVQIIFRDDAFAHAAHGLPVHRGGRPEHREPGDRQLARRQDAAARVLRLRTGAQPVRLPGRGVDPQGMEAMLEL